MSDAQATVKQGTDLEQFQRFVEWLEENPDKGRLTLRARGYYEGEIGRSTQHVSEYELDGEKIDRPTRHYTISYGAWKEVEKEAGHIEPSDRLEPVEAALSALGACVQTSISINAAREGLDLEGMTSEVEVEVDPRVLFGVKDLGEGCLQNVTINLEIEGEEVDEELTDKIRRMAARSPVHAMVSTANRVNLQVEEG